ncbi:hypothetical protein [Litorihabitans aurantiacus]|uniref:Uncharacterized protein n=1 Tax=Litorihabitans aurantiacus TaxID=1930061 RepID=A0AA37XDB0_9MICO|nr:hypothetical protein [Litorihabitans aurantiacus]GMA31351.1 hypothetical protein GCM10025875_13430 [Litorihabitans aurantiacus]
MTPVIVVATLALAALGGTLLVPFVLGAASRGASAARAVSLASVQAVLRGGLVIGLLERIATAGCVLAGQPEGIAVVVAIKGLGRYPELRDPVSAAGASAPGETGGPGQQNPRASALGAAVSERFIIGTLTSLIWAVAVGAVGRWLLGVV